MIAKLMAIAFLLVMIAFSLNYIYQNTPGNPIELTPNKVDPSLSLGLTSSAPLFAENLRFNHNKISYSISPLCTKSRRDSMLKAFQIFSDATQMISFYSADESSADILVGCSNEFLEVNNGYFIAGEGGPSTIINTSGFKVIEKGKILLYKDEKCDYPVVEVHELGHVFGFDHTPNEESVMNSFSDCDQRITSEMVEVIKELYSIKPLPDARITEISATKRGRYVDFNITIINEGLEKIDNMDLIILSVKENEKSEVINLGDIGIGYGRTIRATNIKIASRETQEIKFILDPDNKVEELRKDNNDLTLVVKEE